MRKLDLAKSYVLGKSSFYGENSEVLACLGDRDNAQWDISVGGLEHVLSSG